MKSGLMMGRKRIEYLRNDDFLFSYWDFPARPGARGGIVMWLVNRGGEMFLFEIALPQSDGQFPLFRDLHFQMVDNGYAQAHAINAVIKAMFGDEGEVAVYGHVKQNREILSYLEQQFEIFEATMQGVIEAQVKAREAAENEAREAAEASDGVIKMPVNRE